MELGLSREIVGQLLKGKEEVEEKADKVTVDVEHKYIFLSYPFLQREEHA